MKTIIDQQKIHNHALIANVMSVGGLLILLVSVLMPMFLPGFSNMSFVLMIVGLGVAMVGIYFANRWVRKPRPEEKLDHALKSLNDSCHIYHYPSLICDHVLLTPCALVIIETVGLSGMFSFRKGKWKESMSFGRALRYIVEEHLGDPIRAACASESFLRKQLDIHDISIGKAPIKPLVVFTHPAVELKVEDASIPVVKVDKLRKHIPTNLARMDEDTFNKLDDYFRRLTVKD
jgi:hypothetical protein